MFTIQDYAMPETLDEAYKLLMAKKSNYIVGGCAWLRLGKRRIQTAIDLSKCGLDYIRETEEFIEIGAMTSYRSVETNEILKKNFDGVIAYCISSIIGTQFRNTVTVGGSVYGRFGFSDFLTPLLALDTYVVLYGRGMVALEDFMNEPYKKELIEKIMIRKDGRRASYKEFRNERADFPVLNLAVSKDKNQYLITVGARGPKAIRAIKTSEFISTNMSADNVDRILEEASNLLIEEVPFTNNMRASAAYRKILAKVLLKRAVKEVMS